MHYIIDPHFHKVRVYLDLFQLTGAIKEADSGADLTESNNFGVSGKSQRFVEFLKKEGLYFFSELEQQEQLKRGFQFLQGGNRHSQINKFLKDMKATLSKTFYARSPEDTLPEEFIKVERNPKNFVDLMLSRNNTQELRTIISLFENPDEISTES